MNDLNKKLWIRFVAVCLPFAVLLAAAYLVHRGNPGTLLPAASVRPAGIVLFVLAVILAVGLPIVFRTRFHDAVVKSGDPVTLEAYAAYQSRQMALVGAGGVFAGLAYLLVVPNLMLYGAVLSALYGIYSILPFAEKVAGELKAYGYRPPTAE